MIREFIRNIETLESGMDSRVFPVLASKFREKEYNEIINDKVQNLRREYLWVSKKYVRKKI